jgi:hypothetical protein
MRMGRRILPQRRASETFNVAHGDQRNAFAVTIGFHRDGSIGEVFVTGAKIGTSMDAVARDGAILLSLALQHGVPLDVIQHAITRDERGAADTIIGAVVDRLVECTGGMHVQADKV